MKRALFVALAAVVTGCSDSGSSDTANPDRPGESVFLTAMPPGANGNSAGGVRGEDASSTTYPPHYADSLALYGDLAYARPGLKAPMNCLGTDVSQGERPPNNAGEHVQSSDSACNYFKHEGLTPDTVEGTPVLLSCPEDAPCAGKTATITRDGWGVPYIDAQDRGSAEYAFGYAQAQDRLWFFDVIRHVGRGRESEFLGPFAGAYDMDRSYASLAGYDDAELTQMITNAKAKFGPLGELAIADIDNFVAGFNAYIADVQSTPGQIPPEYASIGQPIGGAPRFPPEPWTREDIVASAILIQAFFAGGGGGEANNLLLLQKLDPAFGAGSTSIPAAACAEWRDLRHATDPDAIHTIDDSFPTQSPPRVSENCADPLPEGVAIWDVGSFHALDPLPAPASGGLLARAKPASKKASVMVAARASRPKAAAKRRAVRKTPAMLAAADPLRAAHLALAAGGLPVPNTMSNFIGVTGRMTKDGYPITVMGPQTGYFDPQLLWEVAVVSHGGTPLDFAGRGAVTANLPYIELGRGVDFAWSATSGESDLIDIRVSRMCRTDGTPVIATHPGQNFDEDGDGFPDADGYLFSSDNGAHFACRRFYKRVDTWTATPTAASLASAGCAALPPPAGCPLAPETVTRNILRTHYGPVYATALVGGVPVAVSIQRSTFFGELDTTAPFALATTRMVSGPQSFQQIFNGVTGTFNWLYVDRDNIGYIHSGLYPVRHPQAHPELPVWGDGRFEWAVDQCTGTSHCVLNDAFFTTYGGDGNAAGKAFPGRAVPVAQNGGNTLKGFFEWRDYLSLAAHPRAINPAKGWITSWNNSPARDWWSADGNGTFGPTHRAEMLGKRLQAFIASGKKFDVGNMVEVMGDAAYTDLRGQDVLPLLLEVLDGQAADPNLSQVKTLADLAALKTLLRDWLTGDSSAAWIGLDGAGLGAFRRDRDASGTYDRRAAVVLMDAWYVHLIDRVLPQLALLDGTSPPVSALQSRYDAPRGQGSAYQEGWFEPMRRVLQMALAKPGHTDYRVLRCADGTLAGCRAAVLLALDQAVTDLGGLSAQADWDGSTLSSAPHGCSPGMRAAGCGATGTVVEDYDAVEHTAVSLLPVPTIHWINRPTFQQVIQIKEKEAR
ncbi:MAG TPA: penicillin acylase family protein [Candidatus Binatia bacterium]|nr:penicillin acylase family protein [Candidatus Binatia bacterium]